MRMTMPASSRHAASSRVWCLRSLSSRAIRISLSTCSTRRTRRPSSATADAAGARSGTEAAEAVEAVEAAEAAETAETAEAVEAGEAVEAVEAVEATRLSGSADAGAGALRYASSSIEAHASSSECALGYMIFFCIG